MKLTEDESFIDRGRREDDKQLLVDVCWTGEERQERGMNANNAEDESFTDRGREAD